MKRYLRENGLGVLLVTLLISILAIRMAWNDGKPIVRPPAQSLALIDIYIRAGNLFAPFFTEPFESVMFIFKDGTAYIFTTHHDFAVVAPPEFIVNHLKEKGKEMKDCIWVVHNHMTPSSFSSGDLRFLAYLQACGFKGIFSIYYPIVGTMRHKGDD